MLKLNKKEILRYLGYKRSHELSDDIDELIEQEIIEVQEASNPRYMYQIFFCHPDEENKTIIVDGTNLVLTGNSIYKHLRYAKKVALLATTLGIEIEQVIRRYEIIDLTRSLVLDASCTEFIEKLCDLAECDIEASVRDEGLTLNRRFSPGYGDLPLAIQPTFLKTIKADTKLGISLTDTMLMIPRKSVTAIIGLFEDKELALPKRKQNKCLSCEMEDCNFRIGG